MYGNLYGRDQTPRESWDKMIHEWTVELVEPWIGGTKREFKLVVRQDELSSVISEYVGKNHASLTCSSLGAKYR